MWHMVELPNPNDKLQAIANRLRHIDVDLLILQKRVKRLMEAWDTICFGTLENLGEKQKKRARQLHVNVKGSLERSDKKRGNQNKIENDTRYIPPDQHHTTDNMYFRTKKPFTHEEDDAILKGLETFGTSQWKEIKLAHAQTLRNRTVIQIKDRYRTMIKNNIIEEKGYIHSICHLDK